MTGGLYARVSTSDKDQDPETQLVQLREFVAYQGWDTFCEYVDHAPATDLGRHTSWSQLLSDASRRKFDLLLVWRMDRAFRSVLDAATTLERLKTWALASGPTRSLGWTPHPPSGRPSTTSRWPTLSWSAAS